MPHSDPSEQELRWRQEVLRVNWSKRRAVFDFDQVEIVAAKDEEVERFCVQVGNDMDEWRQPRYKKMTCAVTQECSLSEHTLRILRRTFGEVTYGAS
jgi:arabinogalactan endo-1,4-beta-galactosidase